MAIDNLFDRKVLIRLDDDETAFTCTVKWWLISKKTRVGVAECPHRTWETAVPRDLRETPDGEDGRGTF